MKKRLLTACSLLFVGAPALASVFPAPKTMHPSWDVDKDGGMTVKKMALVMTV